MQNICKEEDDDDDDHNDDEEGGGPHVGANACVIKYSNEKVRFDCSNFYSQKQKVKPK